MQEDNKLTEPCIADAEEAIVEPVSNEVIEAGVPEKPSDIAPDVENINYEELAKADIKALVAEFPELEGKSSITQLDNPLRYAKLRDMGLTPREAYLATRKTSDTYDNRSHLHSAVPLRAGGAGSSMSYAELESAREIFSSLSDADIQRLYKKVTK